ncbi:glycoside hydrolase [Schizophyllum commune]
MRPLYSPDRLPVRMIASGAAIIVALWVLAGVFGPFGPPHPALFDHPPPPPPPPPPFVPLHEPVPPPPFVPLHEPVRPPPTPEEAKTWAARADLVRNAFVHAYNGYRRQAFGHDEVRPVSGKTVDGFNAWAVSAVDGLDTMWLMGLDTMWLMGLGDMFEEAVDLVSQQTWAMGEKQTWAMGEKQAAPFFETTIRYLGGLLGAYAMSKPSMGVSALPR